MSGRFSGRGDDADDRRRRREARKNRRYADELPIFGSAGPAAEDTTSHADQPERRRPHVDDAPPADPWGGRGERDDGFRPEPVHAPPGAARVPEDPSTFRSYVEPEPGHAEPSSHEDAWAYGDAAPTWDRHDAPAADQDDWWQHDSATATATATASGYAGSAGVEDWDDGGAPYDDASSSGPVRYVEERESGRFGRWLLALGVVVVVAVVLVGLAGLWVRGQVDPGGEPGAEVAFTIPSGASTAAIADQLAAEDIVTDATIFQWYARLNDGGPFQAGDYELSRNMAMSDVVEVLEAGPAQVIAGRITIPEGLTIEEIAEVVGRNEQFSEEAFLEVVRSGAVTSKYQPEGKPLEGLLFPETYTLDGGETEVDLLQRMVSTFDDTLDELGYADAEQRVGLSPYETVIVASLVEAEAKADVDRPKISRVIYNRIEQGMPLEIDATVYYALGRRGGSLTRSDLQVDSPYNTRLRDNVGLVPTPIGVAGRASLEAAINPEPGPWLFYVLKDESTHAFSEDYDEFVNNMNRARREGLIP